MKFPWPSTLDSDLKVKAAWEGSRQSAIEFGANTREVKLFLQEWGNVVPSKLSEIMEIRAHTISAILNAIEGFSLPMFSQERLDALMDLLTPKDINLAKDCLICLVSFQDSQELLSHNTRGCKY
jgi:hypothetical protein